MLAPGEGEGLCWEPAVGFARSCVLANPLSWCNLALGGKEHSACSFLLLPGCSAIRMTVFPGLFSSWLSSGVSSLVGGANGCVSAASAGQVTRVES